MRPGIEPAALPCDTHEAQAERVADHCEMHPGQFFSLVELTAACDLASGSKVISMMVHVLLYGVAKSWRPVTCVNGTRIRARGVRVYRVTHRPSKAQLPLFGSA